MSTEVRLDLERPDRTGLHEAVLCAGKSPTQLQVILDEARQRGIDMLFTRLQASAFAQLRATGGELDYDEVSRTAIYRHLNAPRQDRTGTQADETGTPEQQVGEREEVAGARQEKSGNCRVAVVTAGTSDIPVAREAMRTLAFHGEPALEIHDVGVSGLWRLQRQLPHLQDKQVLICVAGMDAALPTVLAGLVPGLVIAVPTSTGYGMARQGETALHALLCSCAQGLVVVNIDNGFGAACAALRALR